MALFISNSKKGFLDLLKLVYDKFHNIEMSHYAVAIGRKTGIFGTWGECEAQVKGFSGARYKKFNTIADAQEYIRNISNTHLQPKSTKASSSYTANYDKYSNNLKINKSSSNPKSKQSNSLKSNSTANQSASIDEDSDDSDLNEMITRQLDDIENRLKTFEKGVDKIIKQAPKSRKTVSLDCPPQPKKRKSNNITFDEDANGYVNVYTDGACSANGKVGARAGFGVYWGDGHQLNTSKPVSGRATNNCGEIQAATYAIKQALENKISKINIYTDSKFLINSVTKWMSGWKRNGWKLQSGGPVKNEKDFKELDSIKNKIDIKWIYVEAHCGIHGNEMADQLAREGAAMYNAT